MDVETAIIVAESAAAVLGYLGFAPNGPHIVAKVKERLVDEPRRKQRELEENVQDLMHAMGETVGDVRRLTDKYDLLAARGKNTATVGQLAGYQRPVDAKVEGYERNQADMRRRLLLCVKGTQSSPRASRGLSANSPTCVRR
jgi:hypothetical protein